MGRYRGATCRIARRFGSDLGLKSRLRDLSSKCELSAPPGVHGKKRARWTDYGRQLQAKQKIKFMYGVSENQFRRYFKLASTQKGATGENLLKLLECRLDNVVYRLGFASTRAEARQLVRHKSIMVNERNVSIPSYLVEPNDIIEVREKSKQQTRVLDALRLAENAGFPDWVTVEVSKITGVFKRVPDRDELSAELEEQLVVELYSK